MTGSIWIPLLKLGYYFPTERQAQPQQKLGLPEQEQTGQILHNVL